MKTSIVQPRKPKSKPDPTLTFPALYRASGGNLVVLATGPRAGAVIHSTEAGYPVGMQYGDSSVLWECATAFTRVTEPITIKFQP